MKSLWSLPAALAGAALALQLAAGSHAEERTQVPDKYKWNLADLYPNEAAWTAAKDELARRIPDLARFEGHLGNSPAKLHEALSALMELDRMRSQLQAYSAMLADEDRRVSHNLDKLRTARIAHREWIIQLARNVRAYGIQIRRYEYGAVVIP